jgi:hypothetical protein
VKLDQSSIAAWFKNHLLGMTVFAVATSVVSSVVYDALKIELAGGEATLFRRVQVVVRSHVLGETYDEAEFKLTSNEGITYGGWNNGSSTFIDVSCNPIRAASSTVTGAAAAAASSPSGGCAR